MNAFRTSELIKEISEVFRDEKGKVNKKLQWKLRVSNPELPKLYGLPKIHKTGPLKMRPVVSNVNSPNYKVAKWLVKELKVLPQPEGRSIKNSMEFAKVIKQLTLSEDEIMVSFDVESLFPSIPIDEALNDMDKWLTECDIEEQKKTIFLKIMRMCMDDSFFQFRGKWYKLTHGTCMGNPLSPIIANIFMSKLEKSLEIRNLLPKWWRRYVDDVFAVIKKKDLDETLKLLNSQYPSIKFTVEPEVNGKLAFLDLILRRIGNMVEIGVFHKPTSTQRLIPATSNCPIQHKMAAFHSMAHRLCNLPLSVRTYKEEYDYIKQAASVNGYRIEEIDRIIKKHADKARKNILTTLFSQDKQEKKQRVRLTFLPKITNKLKNSFRKQNMEIVYSAELKLGTLLGSPKDKTEKLEKSGIYEIVCEECLASYYGQTRRRVSKRYKEHMACIKNNCPTKSAVALHALNNLHLNMESYNVKLKKDVKDSRYLDAYESYYIHKHTKDKQQNKLMNTDEGNIQSILFNCI